MNRNETQILSPNVKGGGGGSLGKIARTSLAALIAATAMLVATPYVLAQTPWSTTGTPASLVVSNGDFDRLAGGVTFVTDDTINFAGDHVLNITGDNSGTSGVEVKTIGDITSSYGNNTGTITFNLNVASDLEVGKIGTTANAIKVINVDGSGVGLYADEVYANTVNIANEQWFQIGTATGSISKIGNVNLGDESSLRIYDNGVLGSKSVLEVGTINGGATSVVSLRGRATVELGGGTFGQLYFSEYSWNTADIKGNITILDRIYDNSLGSKVKVADGVRLTLAGTNDSSSVDTFDLGKGTLELGVANVSIHDLYVYDWIGNGGTLVIAVTADPSSPNPASALFIDGPVTGVTNVTLAGNYASLNALGDIVVSSSGHVDVIYAPTGTEQECFVLAEVKSSRYTFSELWVPNNGDDLSVWAYKATASSTGETSPVDPVIDMLAFDLPMGLERNRGDSEELTRAQYADGPWVRVKGGKLNDGKAALGKNTYQALQVGWDKTVDAANGGVWNAGLFFEEDWLYGKGDYSPWDDGVVRGKLRSKTTGTGVGYYLTREFRNLMYVDFVGRTTWFESDLNLGAVDGAANSYAAKRKTNVFTAGLEVGKTFNSRDGRWILNPYDRLLYNGSSSEKFGLNYGDGSVTGVTVNGYGAWTNRLGARLTLNRFAKVNRSGYYGQSPCDEVGCDPCDPCGSGGRVNSRLFVQGDWYKGFSGKFGGTYVDPVTGAGTLSMGRPKNDVSYGVATVGIVLHPTKRWALTFSGESLFGDVNGYGATFMSKVMF